MIMVLHNVKQYYLSRKYYFSRQPPAPAGPASQPHRGPVTGDTPPGFA